MKKWIVFLVLFVVVIIGMLIKVYFSSVEPVKAAEEKAVKLANKSVQISKVQDFHIYNGLETVNVIEGKNNKGEKIIVWIPEKSKKVLVHKAKEGISKEEAVQKSSPNRLYHHYTIRCFLVIRENLLLTKKLPS